MSAAAREAILGRIGKALGREQAARSIDDVPTAIRERIATPQRHTLPALGGDLMARLIEQMEGVLMDVTRLQTRSDVPAAVTDWLDAAGVQGDITLAPALSDIDWPADGQRRVRTGAASGEEAVSVTPCLAAVAETGSLALASAHATPATLNFLPENHVVVLHEEQVVAHVDDVFPLLRSLEVLPRALNFVTGPSRTADIEQTLEIGAHGPRRMLVLLLPGAAPE